MSFPIVSQPIDQVKALMGDLYHETVDSYTEFRGELTLYVKNDAIVSVCQALKDNPDLKFDFLSDLTAVDNLNDMNNGDSRFHVVYNLFSTTYKHRIRLKAPALGEPPHIASVTPVWVGANWHERECYDMFGIRFDDHPDLRRILMPEDWEGHPLRKDYPVADQEPYEYINKQLADE